jgi:hypothetical protein
LLLIMTLLDVADIVMPDVPGTVISCVSAYTTELVAIVKYTVCRGFDALLFDTLTHVSGGACSITVPFTRA